MKDAAMTFKALSDDTRLRILAALDEKELYAELIAQQLKLAPATVSFHMKKLLTAGLVSARRERYYTLYALNREALAPTLSALVLGETKADGAELSREAQYRAKVLRSFMPNGYCTVLPAQVKKRMIVYEEIFSGFERGRKYPEREVNDVIARHHEDFCAIRRAFVEMGWMKRESGVYEVTKDAT